MARILVVDDDKDICKLIELLLVKAGFQVITAQDGASGLEQARAMHPDLLILDLDLPGLPGEEVCRELKKDPATEVIPVIMLTGKDSDADRVIGRVIGASYYIPKPFDNKDLVSKVKACVKSA